MRKKITVGYLGPRETEVVSRLSYERLSLITTAKFDRLFDFSVGVRKQVIFRLTKKGILRPIKRGSYVYSGLESGPYGAQVNEWQIPSILYPKKNYYVGYSAMYHYYGFTDQIFQVLHVLNTRRKEQREVGGVLFKSVKISERSLYGMESILIKGMLVQVSDRERTLVDLLHFPGPVGGMQVAFDIVKKQMDHGHVKVKKLVEYAARFPTIRVRKQIGYLLEKVGKSKREWGTLQDSIRGTSLTALVPGGSRKGPIDKTWGLILNDS
jgi:predicted transcriptional regulator of viral defense system